MNKQLLLTMLAVLFVMFSVSAVCASEINVTDSYAVGLADDTSDVSAYDYTSSDISVNNDSYLSSEESEDSNTLLTNTDSDKLKNSDQNIASEKEVSVKDSTLGAKNSGDVCFVVSNITVRVDEISGGYIYPVVINDVDGNGLANKKITLTFNGKKSTMTTNKKGLANFNISVAKTGSYPISLAFAGDANYNALSCPNLATVIVEGIDVYFVAPNRTLGIEEISKGYSYPIILKDADGNTLANKKVHLYFNGEKYTETTNNKGWAYFNITAKKTGNYKVTLKFGSDRYYNSLSSYSITTVKVTGVNVQFVAPNRTLGIEEISKGYSYPVILKDADGNTLANKKVHLYFNGEKYTETTNNKGWAYFNITAKKTGNYKVTLKFGSDGYYNSLSSYSITTVKVTGVNVQFVAPNRTLRIDDIMDGYSYPVILKDADGNTLANKQVSLYFNGEKYTETTNNKGWAYFNIDADKIGNYKVTLKFASDGYYNSLSSYSITTVKVVGVGVEFIASDLVLDLDEIADGYIYPVILKDVDGNFLANKKVTITFNGKKQSGTTDNSGRVYFNINANKKGNYGVSLAFASDGYYSSLSCPNFKNIQVMVYETRIAWMSGNSFASGSQAFKVLLTDIDGAGLANKVVKLTINANSYYATTASNGYATFNLNLNPNTYFVLYSFEGDNKFIPSDGVVEIKVVNPTVSINDILTGSTLIKEYYNVHKVLPLTVSVGNNYFTMPEFFYLMNQAIYRLEYNNLGLINLKVGVNAPQFKCAEAVYSCAVTEDRYVAIARYIINYMDTYNQAPDHVVDVAGKIGYEDYLVMSSRVLDFYRRNGDLPNFVSFVSSGEPYLNITDESSAGNPFGLNGKKVWIDADGGSNAIKWELANALKNLGWDVHVGDTYANAHYEDYHNVYPGYVLINIYNGFCAGTMRELATSSIQDLLNKKHVVCVPVFHTEGWTEGMRPYRYGDFSGYSAQRAWDDDFSTMDPAIDNVEKFFRVNNIKYCAGPTCQYIVNQFVKGGYFASIGG